jgi:hypothetical protein
MCESTGSMHGKALLVGYCLSAITTGAAGQEAPRRPASAGASYAQTVRVVVDTCLIANDLNIVRFKLREISADQVAIGEQECPAEQARVLSELQSRMTAGSMEPACQKLVTDLHLAAMVFFDNYVRGPAEPVVEWRRRISQGSAEIKAQASRARIGCAA